MAKIQEYTSEESAAGPQAAMSPNTELLGAEGKGLEKFGASIETGATAIHQRQSQMDSGDAFGKVTQYKVDQLQEQDAAMNAGKYDVATHKESLQNWQNEHAADYETPAGKNTFLRQSNRMIGALLTRGVHAQKAINASNAVAQYNDNVNGLATATRLAPGTFEDNIAAAYEHSMELPPEAQEKSDIHAENTIAREAVKGVADIDADKAAAMLQDPKFVQYLDARSLDELHTTVKAAQRAERLDAEGKDNTSKKASAAAAEKYGMSILPQIINGKMSIKDAIMKSPSEISFSDKKKLADSIHDMQKLTQETSPAVLEGIRHRMLLPDGDPKAITSVMQLYGVKGLSVQEANKLANEYVKTPLGAAEKADERNLYSSIKGKLKAPISGMADTDYNTLVGNAMSDYQKAKQKIIKEGGDPSELRDPSSNKYFLNGVQKRSMSDLIKMQSAAAGGQAKETPIVHASPGIKADVAGANEIERTDEKGRVIIYDAKTKKPLRVKGS